MTANAIDQSCQWADDPDHVQRIIDTLWKRFGQTTTAGASGKPVRGGQSLHARIISNQDHFHALPAADPQLPEPYNEGSKFQSDVPRNVWKDLKSRMCENPYLFDVMDAQDTEQGRRDAGDLKLTLQAIFEQIEERHGFSIQEDLADGQIVSAAGMLHWWRNDEETPDAPDYDELDDLAELDAKGQKRFTKDDYAPDSGKSKSKKYRETEESYQDRVKRAQALAGAPYDAEVLPLEACAWQEDRSCANGLARVVVRRRMGLLDYQDALSKSDGKPKLSEHDIDPESGVYEEVAAPETWQPSGSNWGDTVTVYQLWTRTEFYELIAEGDTPSDSKNWQITKCFKHEWEMPNFTIVPAMHFNSADPLLAYQPALEGVYRVKPFYDYHMSLQRCIAESIALPFYYLSKTNPNAPGALDVDEDGNTLFFTRNAALSMKVPDGYELKQIVYQMNPAFIESGRDLKQELTDAMPSTGKAQFAVDTKPWAARLEQAQESVEPGHYIENQAKAIQIMARSLTKDMSRRETPVYVFGRQEESGALDMSTVVGVQPAQIASLQVTVAIGKISEAEKVTAIQLAKELLDDPNFPITPETVLRDYVLVKDPQSDLADWLSWKAFLEYVMPGRQKQLLAKTFGTEIQLGPDGAAIGPQGQQMSPEQVLQANGLPGVPNPTSNGAGGTNLTPPPQTSMGPLVGLNAPGTMALPGRAG